MSEPLFLQSVMQEKIWGGTHLRDVFDYDIPSDHVGEYWAISAHPNGVSTIKNGRYAGQTLDVLYAEHRELFGNRQEPVFPLLTKILDANDWLSVQVHPDDAYGLEHEGELGKTECWYIIAAEPGASATLLLTLSVENDRMPDTSTSCHACFCPFLVIRYDFYFFFFQ